jgi:hypothetical protein
MAPDFQLLLDPPPDTLLEEAQRETAESLRPAQGWDDKQFLAAFRRAVRLEPNDPDYYFMLGEHPVEIVPGLRHRLRFQVSVEKPFLAPEKTIFY